MRVQAAVQQDGHAASHPQSQLFTQQVGRHAAFYAGKRCHLYQQHELEQALRATLAIPMQLVTVPHQHETRVNELESASQASLWSQTLRLMPCAMEMAALFSMHDRECASEIRIRWQPLSVLERCRCCR